MLQTVFAQLSLSLLAVALVVAIIVILVFQSRLAAARKIIKMSEEHDQWFVSVMGAYSAVVREVLKQGFTLTQGKDEISVQGCRYLHSVEMRPSGVEIWIRAGFHPKLKEAYHTVRVNVRLLPYFDDHSPAYALKKAISELVVQKFGLLDACRLYELHQVSDLNPAEVAILISSAIRFYEEAMEKVSAKIPELEALATIAGSKQDEFTAARIKVQRMISTIVSSIQVDEKLSAAS